MDHRQKLCKAFNKLHEQLALVRAYAGELEDPVVNKLVDSMEFGLLAPMLNLRKHLDIPYDWHEDRPAKNHVVVKKD